MANGQHAGIVNLTGKLRREGYPAGSQTLRHNHQWKKEILRRHEQGRKTV
jgi:hypothetical protein